VKGGPGSAFWFDVTLPVTEVEAWEEPTSLRDIVGYEGPRRVVLVADDKQYNRLLLVDMLEPLGFEVRSANDGQQAMEVALELRPDAIVMDLVMPIKTGFEAAQEIRGRPELKDVFIVAASASVLEADREKSLVAGCDAFLPKPIRTERLLDLLATHLGLSWIYAAPAVEAEAMAGPLVPPPAEELAELHELARLGLVWDIQQRALRLAEMDAAYVPFSDRLQELTKSFEIDQIEALVAQFIEAGLVPPPQEELEVLLDLALQGDMQIIQERAAHLEQMDERFSPFAGKLRQLAKSFDERAILTLIKQYVEQEL
jgi:CheY-like chemotaxis protein